MQPGEVLKEKTMIKVKWIKAHWAFAYSAGDIGFVSPANAEMLMGGGFIIPLPDDPEPVKNPLPDDLPARDQLFAAGFETLEAIKAAGGSIFDAGLSRPSVKKVEAYLNNLGI